MSSDENDYKEHLLSTGDLPVLDTDNTKKKGELAKRLGDFLPLYNRILSMGDTGIPKSPSSSSLNEFDELSSCGSDRSTDMSLHQAAKEGAIHRVNEQIGELKRIYGEGERFAEEICQLNDQGYSPLHLATRYNHKSVVAALLKHGAPIDQPDGEDRNTPLLLATKFNMLAIVSLLVKMKANAVVKNIYGTTALHYAARRKNEEICKILLNIPVEVDARDSSGQTPLHLAMVGRNRDVASLLIERGADVNAADMEGERPLHFAAAEGSPNLICILTQGAISGLSDEEREVTQRKFVNEVSNESDTALHIASQAGYQKTVEVLIAIGADVNVTTDTKSTPLHLAAISGQIKTVECLVNNHAKIHVFDDEHMTPFHRACQYGRLKVVKYLQSLNARMEAKDKDHLTPLMCAVWRGRTLTSKYLLECGAKISVTDTNERTVFHKAAEENNHKTLQMLLDCEEVGDLINKRDKEGKTALHLAAINGGRGAMRLLIKNKADSVIHDREDMTALHYAAQLGHLSCVKLLIAAVSGVVHHVDKRGKTPLHYAAENGHIEVCDTLLNKGADSSCRDNASWSPLIYAARGGYLKTMAVLIENDVNIDALDKNNSSALHHAAINGKIECVNKLLECGASVSLRNKSGKNCMDLAAHNFQFDVCLALINHRSWKKSLQNIAKDTKNVDDSNDDSENMAIRQKYPLQRLIEVAPAAAEAVLDKLICCSDLPPTDPNYSVTYDFDLLDKLPRYDAGSDYFAPETMVKFHRENLLSHPITVKLIHHKWGQLGRYIYLANLFVYVLFICLLTSMVLLEKEKVKANRGKNIDYCHQQSGFSVTIAWLTIIFATVQMLKECAKAIFQRFTYLKNFTNIVEFILYLSTFLFMLPFIMCQTNANVDDSHEAMKWNAAVISILLGWINLLIYLKHLPFFGLYVAMFQEVFKSLINVLLVYFILMVGFALAFYSVLDVQSLFRIPGISIVTVFVTMVGEMNYDSIFTENFVKENQANMPYKGISVTLFVIFLILMTIVTMNLLVGLAVDDIDSVQETAFLRILKAEVENLRTFEKSIPKSLLKKFHTKKLVCMVNQTGVFGKLLEKFTKIDYSAIQEEQDGNGGVEETIAKEVEVQKVELKKHKEKLKTLFDRINEQLRDYKKLARKLDVVMD